MYELYQAYFKHQCEIHPELLHKDELGARVFEMSSLEEAWGNARTQNLEKGIIFLLIDYSYGLGGPQAGDDRQLKQGGFLIAKHADNRENGSPATLAAIATCEKIANQIAVKMIADSQNEHPLFNYSINTLQDMGWNAQVVREVGDGSYYGWLCVFDFSNYIDTCLGNEEDENWKQLTPHDL